MSDLLRVYFEEDRTGTSTKNMLEREHTNKLIHCVVLVWYSSTVSYTVKSYHYIHCKNYITQHIQKIQKFNLSTRNLYTL